MKVAETRSETRARPGPAVNPERLAADLDRLAALTEPGRPWTRVAFSDLHRKARAWLTKEMLDLGLEVRLDPGGNLIGRLEGRESERPPLATGSHSDTVPSGGRYDGAAGVLAGLEIVRALREAGVELRHPLEVIDFLAEEPNRYGLSCVGSRALVGLVSAEQLARRAEDGSSLSDGIRRMGGDPDRLGSPLLARGTYTAFVELHIEQGRILEQAGEDVGAVTAIAGITRVAVEVLGRADHAGATPMDQRRDALVGASLMVARVEEIALHHARTGTPVVATVGRLDVEPNASNVVPGLVRFVLEVRSGDDAAAADCMRDALEAIGAIADQRALVTSHSVLGTSSAVAMDKAVADAIMAAAAKSGARARTMVSGAGHDAAYMARIAPAGMVFIPCRDGRSHCPEEFAEPEQVALGAQVLLQTLLSIDGLESPSASPFR